MCVKLTTVSCASSWSSIPKAKFSASTGIWLVFHYPVHHPWYLLEKTRGPRKTSGLNPTDSHAQVPSRTASPSGGLFAATGPHGIEEERSGFPDSPGSLRGAWGEGALGDGGLIPVPTLASCTPGKHGPSKHSRDLLSNNPA